MAEYVTYLDGAGGRVELLGFSDGGEAEDFITNLSDRRDWLDVVELLVDVSHPKVAHGVANASRVLSERRGRTDVELPLRFR